MAPFPIYDTSYVEDLKTLIEKMEDKLNEYDKEPVVACRLCKSLHIRTDDEGNEHCYRCGSTNELIEFETIYDYNKFLNEQKNS
jgi:uncharacterized paraquat-inducible protein A